MTRRDAAERRIRRAYRALLDIYPSPFLDEFGEDIEETFVDRLRASRDTGTLATTRFLAAAVADVIGSGIRERLTTPLRSPHMFYWQDVRYALRLMRKSPIFTALTVVVLGGGLGVSIFTFSFLYTVMLRPLPVSGGDRIVRISQTQGPSTIGLDAFDLARMRPAITRLTDIGAFTGRELVLGEGTESRRVIHATASEWTIFQATRTSAALGRGFRKDDEARGADPVVVLSHRTWLAAFGGDTSVIGRRVMLNGQATQIIGVMPRGYGFPVAADAWVPLGAEALSPTAPGRIVVDAYARLAAGAGIETARAELQVLAERVRQSRPVAPESERAGGSSSSPVAPTGPTAIGVETFPRAQLGEEGPLVFGVLNLLAALILLLACVNVINLLLARANDRAREMAVRLALGASRGRLVAQSLLESALLTMLGGTLATGIAAWGLSAINGWAQAHIPGNLAFWWVWQLDRPALLAAAAFVTLTIALLGGVVSARATSVNINAVLQDTTSRGGRRQGRVARVLVATQVATVSVLMFFGVMAGILASRITHVDLGFDTHNLMSAGIQPPNERYDSPAKRAQFFQSIQAAMEQAPEVGAVAVRAQLANLNDASGADRLDLDRGASSTGSAAPRAFVQAVLGPLVTLGSSVREGRAFDMRDTERSTRTAIVSAAFAARHWPRASAIGRQVRLTGLGETEWRTVVGVAGDVPLGNPLARDRSALAVYVPLAQADANVASVVFRHHGNATAAIATLHRSVTAIDPTYLPDHVASFDEILETTALMARSVAKLFSLCFGFALLLAVSGTYGLMARAIAQRTREIGIRRALGATDGSIVQLLLSQGGRQLGVGAVVALPLMLVVGIGFARYFPVGVAVPVITGVAVAATIVGVVLAATYLPTRRVLGVPPREALGSE